MTEKDMLTLHLPQDHVGQILDGLKVLIEQWEYTETYLQTGEIDDGSLIRECSDPEEARAIGKYYREIASSIESQMESAHPKDSK